MLSYRVAAMTTRRVQKSITPTMSKLVLPPTDLNIRPYYYFLHVAEAGSFSKAASLLSKDQPQISKEIRQLEENLGVQLFHRTGRGVVLTSDGEALAAHVRVLLSTIIAARKEMAAARSVIEGDVAIALPPLFGEVLTVDLVERFREKFPGVRLSFHEGFSTDILAWLSEGTVDLAVVYNAPKISTLLVEFLVEDDLWLLGAPERFADIPDGPVKVQTLALLPLVIAPKPHKLRHLVELQVHRYMLDLNIVNEVNGTATTLELVNKGLGFTVYPRSLVPAAKSLAKLEARRLHEVEAPPRLFLVNSMQRPLTAATRQVMTEIAARFTEIAKARTNLDP